MIDLLTVYMPKYGFIHIATVLFFPALAVASYFIFKKKSEKAKEIYLWILMAIAFLATWITFAVALIEDYGGAQRANFWARLPLHMCSINVILYPVFFGIRKRASKLVSSTLFSYMYFFGSAGALLAMVVTAPGDCLGAGVNFFQYNVLTYWLKHGLIFILPIMFVVLGFYRPKLIDIVKATVFLVGLLCIMELVNLLFSWFNQLCGGNEIANFFYTRTGVGTAVLSTFYGWIPVELLYMFPLVVIAVPMFFIYYSPIGIMDLVKRQKAKKAAHIAQ